MKNARLFTAVIFCSLLALSSCQKSNGKKKNSRSQVLSLNIKENPQTLYPQKVRSLADTNMMITLMEGLFRMDANAEPQKALVEDYTVSDNGLNYKFKLRRSQWSDGEALTAHDFVYAYKKALTPHFQAANVHYLYCIKNAKEVREAKMPLSLLGIRASDDYTLEMQLVSSDAGFLEKLCLPMFLPVPSKKDRINPNWHLSDDEFVCNGPFKLDRWSHSNEICALRNESYWDAKNVELDVINMMMLESSVALKMFENKELQWEGSPYTSIAADEIDKLSDNDKLKINPMLGTYWIRTNVEHSKLKSENLRKALSMSINRELLVEAVARNQESARGLIPPGIKIHEGEATTLDLDLAKEHLQKGLDELKVSREKCKDLVLTYASSDRAHGIAQALQSMWLENLGLDVKLDAVEAKVYFDRLSRGDYCLSCGSWISDTHDPMEFLELFETKDRHTNNTNWESSEFQNLLLQAKNASSQERGELLMQAEQIICQKLPIIPLFHFSMMHVQDDALKNVALSSSGRVDFKNAYLRNEEIS
jgi:oligopeptide transport system substrate-binding protein